MIVIGIFSVCLQRLGVLIRTYRTGVTKTTISPVYPPIFILNPTAERAPMPGRDENLLTPAEVAAMFRVNPKTVTRWARAGKITAVRTLGGHRRFRESEIRSLAATQGQLQ